MCGGHDASVGWGRMGIGELKVVEDKEDEE